MAKRLEDLLPGSLQRQERHVLRTSSSSTCARSKDHRREVDDIAKRLDGLRFPLADHVWPVPGTLMVEPTECESQGRARPLLRRAHRDPRVRSAPSRTGTADREDNVLKNAPHTAEVVTAKEWNRPYPRDLGAFPVEWTRSHKFWPQTSRIDDVYGDRNLVASRAAVEVAVAQTA